MSGTSCSYHPDMLNVMPSKTVGPIVVSTHTDTAGKVGQEPLGIEMPNPNLRLYQNFVGDYAAYPVRVPVETKTVKQLPPATLYQRATRRPWDITTQQFNVMMNKRKSWSLATVLVLYGCVYPFVPKPNATVNTGPRPGLGLESSHGVGLPGPKTDRSFAGL
eukprot:TRINITY_DN38154_c0_g1_i1.p1 TRINITY_DN38154_c0_g1~~TRINITY_DN38154_c0_g1_i1.p1  ORF type:complete len:162 (+),score=38.53 TRINITY_DN38154_c0_g1_i1:63-548(+)